MPVEAPVTRAVCPASGLVMIPFSIVPATTTFYLLPTHIISEIPPRNRFKDFRSPRRRNNMAIKVVTICGSIRPGNYTSKALRLALDEFAKHKDVEVTPIYLDKLDLPLPGRTAKDP